MNKTWIGCHPTNYTEGRSSDINGIVIHWIAGTLVSCDGAFQTPNRQGSAHYGIGGNEVHQYVREEDTAWHAGNWDVNCRTIGIEHEGSPTIPISEETYRTSAKLCREICNRYSIEPNEENITPHNKWASTQCPGTFDIPKLIRMIKEGDSMTEAQKEDIAKALCRTKIGCLNKTEIQYIKDNFGEGKRPYEDYPCINAYKEYGIPVLWQLGTGSWNVPQGEFDYWLPKLINNQNEYRHISKDWYNRFVAKPLAEKDKIITELKKQIEENPQKPIKETEEYKELKQAYDKLKDFFE